MAGKKGMPQSGNRGAGGRIGLNLSLADTPVDGARLTFFREMARKQIGHDPSDDEIKHTARSWYYAQDRKARKKGGRRKKLAPKTLDNSTLM